MLFLSHDPRQPPVQVSFHGGWRMNMVKPPILADNGICLASVEDIFGCKCMISYRRPKIRDYRDIAAILERTDLTIQDGLECARAIFGKAFNPMLAVGAMTYFMILSRRVVRLPFLWRCALKSVKRLTAVILPQFGISAT